MNLTDEQLRILRAAAERRLDTNEHGRWVIEGEDRPARKDRETLMRKFLITWPHYMTRETLTPQGARVLASAEKHPLQEDE
jgi:hypothetical protein